MKKILGIVISVIVILGFFTFYLSNQEGADQTYLLPSGFEGCVVIYYNVKGAPPLKIDNNEMVYRVPKNGVIETSSPYDTGWASEKSSGPYQTTAYYVDEKGEIIEKLPQENLRFGALGSNQGDTPGQEFFYQIFGTKETEDKGCPQVGM